MARTKHGALTGPFVRLTGGASTPWRSYYLHEHLRSRPGMENLPGPGNFPTAQRGIAGTWSKYCHERGLVDPTGATDLLGRMDAVAGKLRSMVATNARDSIVDELSGADFEQVDPAEFAGRLREALVDELVAGRTEDLLRHISKRAQSRLNVAAQRAVRDAGEKVLIRDVLAPEAKAIIKAAGKAGDSLDKLSDLQDRWDALVDVSHRLRESGALPTAGAGRLEYVLARPDLAHDWRLERCAEVKEAARVEQGNPREALVHFIPFGQGKAKLTVSDIAAHPEWGPGVYTAQEVLDNALRWNSQDDSAADVA